MLRLGFGRADTTPEPGLRLAGTPPFSRVEEVAGRLGGRVLLADDGARRVAIVCLDLMVLPTSEVATLRDHLAAVGGLPPEAILVACSHTHGAPFTFAAGNAAESEVFGYLDAVYPKLAEAMATAVADLRPRELFVGRTTAPGWAFNRRPIYANGQVATHGRARGEDFAGMEETADDDLQLLLARDPDGAVGGGLVGFACHPTVLETEPVVSADYPGVLVEALEARHGGVFGFLLGAAGDTAPNDPTAAAPDHGLGRTHLAGMGRALADRVDEARAAGRRVDAERVGVATVHLRLPQRRPTPEQVTLAQWYLEEAPPDLDERAFTRRFSGHDHFFSKVPPRANERHVRELLGMWEWQRRAGTRELIEEVEIQVVTLGDVAVAAYPVELFTAFGRRLKARSPFADTFVATLTNGWHGYAPTVDAFGRGGYEPFLAYQSRLVAEAGDLMTDAALDLLHQLAAPR